MNLIGNINAIPFRRFRGGGGVAPFPSIPGMIARYSASGLTNEQMAANPVWVDKTGNGHDLQLKNFAWKGMSGVGGYIENYDSNRWLKVASRIDTTWTYKSFNARSIKDNIAAQLFYQSSLSDTGFRVLSCTIKVSGLTDGQGIEYISNGTRPTVIMRIENDGIYHLPSFDFGAKNAYYGFKFLKLQESCNITIEQLPLYPGALVFDGVDDYGTCNNFPVLTKEKGYTVVALRQWIEEKNDSTALVSNCKNWNQDGAFLFEYNNLRINFLNVAISFGHVSLVDRGKSPFSYQTSKLYNGKNIKPGSFIGSNELVVGKGNKDFPTVSNAAIWEIVILDHDATEEELTKIKDYFVKTYPWLFPDQAWTVVGKTNEDKDRATIANITGNGNDLVLSNFGFAEGSGYNEEGEYAGYLVTDGVDDMIGSSIFEIGKDFTIIGEWKFMDNIIANAGISKALSLFVYNTNNGLRIFINNTTKGPVLNTKTLKAICSDGRVYSDDWSEMIVNEEQPITSSKSSLLIGINGNNFAKISLKNLAIYNQILSKDDCIKVYNYLQTLKAK